MNLLTVGRVKSPKSTVQVQGGLVFDNTRKLSCCYSGTNVVGVINHSLVGFKTHSTIYNPCLTLLR